MKEFPDPPAWGDIGARVPPDVDMEALRKTADDLIAGNPVNAGSVIARAAAEDPKLARQVLVSAAMKKDGPELDDIAARQDYWLERLKSAADRRAKKGDEAAEADYTRKMLAEAKVKPKTNHRHAARIIAQYEREVRGAERIQPDPLPPSDPIAQVTEEFQLTPEQTAELEAERGFINDMLKRETSEIETYAACLFGDDE